MRLPLILALTALPAFAETPANIAPRVGAPGAAARLVEAHRLYDLGLAAHDPVLVLAAARLMQGVTLQVVSRDAGEPPAPEPAKENSPKDEKPAKAEKKPKKETEASAPDTPIAAIRIVPDPAQEAPLPGALDPKAMLATARDMLPDGELLRDVIAAAETEVPPPGDVAQVTSLVQAAGGKTTFALAVAGQSYGEIALLRLGGSPGEDPDKVGHLTFTVTDAAGNPVCADASATAGVVCGVVPREAGKFLVTVENDGLLPAPYLLISN